ncbi:transcriptional regulator with XRE-family HTH domain [Kibdelosporangium banguiense]|uniref:Transcriptional regulator with XRE-family HTH domain n=1 Tax=Kibdelosporangium banguiense TaxID=1365924 RepID=A0ABS4TDZ4_9PSEU|nr:helix-turn-helix transcriptional regulator [Kibdelosporangium banguiense]MBP2322637.1 transcriptional regulator with XRE-family HTH domain [Kibdelosporangium banguiense]
MVAVERWTGAETKALRLAMRHTVRGFAEHLGVGPKTVSKWEQRGDTITLLPETQEILDTALRRAPDEVRERFAASVEVRSEIADVPSEPLDRDSAGLPPETVLVPVQVNGREVLVAIPRRTLLQAGLGAALTSFAMPEGGLGVLTGPPLPADAAMNLPWSRDGMLRVVDGWVESGLIDRRPLPVISGKALRRATADYWNDGPQQLPLPLTTPTGGVGHEVLEQIEQSIPALQRLDDANGGGAHLAYVGAYFRSVAVLLRQGSHPDRVERRLFAALADIGQLAGWMAFDAGKHGLAQRYFFTTLRASKEAGYRSMAAHVFADLAFQAASREQSGDAIGLGEAAVRVAAGEPATLRASVATRLAYGYAVAGQLKDFERSYQMGLEALTDRGEDEPAWMYFLTPNHLDTQAGYALVHAGVLSQDADDRQMADALLDRGGQLLDTGAHNRSLADASQRRAMFEGSWLAVAAASRGDLVNAVAYGQQAVARTARVQSPRSMDVLGKLAGRLRWRAQDRHVSSFLPELEAALSQ